VLAGGCFWGGRRVQAREGRVCVVSGYSGGGAATARYGVVSTGMTGHASRARSPTIRRRFHTASCADLLFGGATIRPVDRQGPDVGSQYRSAISHGNETERRETAQAYSIS